MRPNIGRNDVDVTGRFEVSLDRSVPARRRACSRDSSVGGPAAATTPWSDPSSSSSGSFLSVSTSTRARAMRRGDPSPSKAASANAWMTARSSPPLACFASPSLGVSSGGDARAVSSRGGVAAGAGAAAASRAGGGDAARGGGGGGGGDAGGGGGVSAAGAPRSRTRS